MKQLAPVLLALGLAFGPGAAPVLSESPAAEQALDPLWDALQMPATLEVMRDEGRELADNIASDYLTGRAGMGWLAEVARIHDPAAMAQIMRPAFDADLAGADVQPMLDFFDSPLGRRIVTLEVSVRRAFLEPDAEDAARARVRNGDVGAERMALIDRFIATNDLVEFNTAGAMNTNFAFLQGLATAELFEMSEQDILARVWNDAESGRADTEQWLRAYLSTAYAPLGDDDLRAYIAFSETDAGRRLNRALFAGFGEMYVAQYHALGVAVARHVSAQEL